MDADRDEWLSTGQAARYCAVKPDTVLKWIKRGRLRAERTAGGHYRIPREELEPFVLRPRGPRDELGSRRAPGQPLMCWEYFARRGEVTDECRRCIAYRSRAAWCFQMAEMSEDIGHMRRFCQNSCERCTYYRRVMGLATAVLVVTADEEAGHGLTATDGAHLHVELAASGYDASRVIDELRPAFVVLDHDLLSTSEPDLLEQLAADTRVPGLRVILAASRAKAARVRAAVRDDVVVGVIEKPLAVEEIAAVVDAFPVEVAPPAETI